MTRVQVSISPNKKGCEEHLRSPQGETIGDTLISASNHIHHQEPEYKDNPTWTPFHMEMSFKTQLFSSIWCHFTFITQEEFELVPLILETQLSCWSDVLPGQIFKCKTERGKHGCQVCGLCKFLQVTKETNASSNHQIRMSEHIILLFHTDFTSL